MSDLTAKQLRNQKRVDSFYATNGECCGGCDWWRHSNPRTGECTKAAPVAGDQRYGMLGIQTVTLQLGAGFPMTRIENHCGDFKDTFDWASLPVNYLHAIGRVSQ